MLRFFKQKTLLWSLLVLAALAVAMPLIVYAQYIDIPQYGYHSTSSTLKAVKSYETSIWSVVSNRSSYDYFIPTKSGPEVTALTAHTPTSVYIGRCGDRICQPTLGENCSGCPNDCGICSNTTYVGICGNMVCEGRLGETDVNCPYDCNSSCCAPSIDSSVKVAAYCRLYIDSYDCASDSNCLWKDRAGVARCVNKPSACWSVSAASCDATPGCDLTSGNVSGSKISNSCSKYCGDNICSPEIDENSDNCFNDCAPTGAVICGDTICNAAGGESCRNCPVDCGYCGDTCGDGFCNASEAGFPMRASTTCPIDCGPDVPDGLGHGFCLAKESNEVSCSDEVCSHTFFYGYASWVSDVDTEAECDALEAANGGGYGGTWVTNYAGVPGNGGYVGGCHCNWNPNTNSCETSPKGCQQLLNMTDCERNNCEWFEVFSGSSCGDGACTGASLGGTETCSNCTEDCGYCYPSGTCMGPVSGNCGGKTNSQCTAAAGAGCYWTVFDSTPCSGWVSACDSQTTVDACMYYSCGYYPCCYWLPFGVTYLGNCFGVDGSSNCFRNPTQAACTASSTVGCYWNPFYNE